MEWELGRTDGDTSYRRESLGKEVWGHSLGFFLLAKHGHRRAVGCPAALELGKT